MDLPGDIIKAPGPSMRDPNGPDTLGAPNVISADSPEPISSRARPVGGWRYTFISLENRDFRRLWLGTVFMIAGFQMQAIAQGYLVYTLTGSAKILGLVSVGMALPLLAMAPIGGALADRVDRKRLIQIGQGVSAVLALFVALSIVTDTLTWHHLLVVAVFQGAVFSFSAPARQALLPQLVERERLGNAIALVSAGMCAPALIAPALGGILYAFVGPEGVYLVVVVLAVVAVALTTSIHVSAPLAERPRTRVAADIGEGLAYFWKHTTLRVLLIISFITVMLSSPAQSLLPVLIVDVYGRESGALGLMVSAMGIGSLIGTLVIASLRGGRRGLLLIVSGFASGIALIIVGALPFYFVGVAAMVLLGLGNAGQWSLNQVLLMGEIDDRYRGRAMSVYMMIFGVMPLAVMPAALVVDRIGPPPVIGALGVALLVFSTLLLFTQRRIRRLS